MWTNYWHEKDSYKKVKILTEIVNIQPFISTYYEATENLVQGQYIPPMPDPLQGEPIV